MSSDTPRSYTERGCTDREFVQLYKNVFTFIKTDLKKASPFALQSSFLVSFSHQKEVTGLSDQSRPFCLNIAVKYNVSDWLASHFKEFCAMKKNRSHEYLTCNVCSHQL